MKRTIIICLALIGCLASANRLHAQTSINLAISNIDSAKVQLNWNNTFGIDSIYLTYSTIFSSKTQKFASPVPSSAMFPRANPTGPIETFDIKMIRRGGIIEHDTIVHANVYGGVVIVEDDILYGPVIDHCGYGNTQDTAFYFVRYCLVANKDLACNISKQYLRGGEEGGPVDEVDYTNHMVQELEYILYSEEEDGSVQDCEVYDGNTRRAKNKLISSLASMSPNPFSDMLAIKFDRESVESLSMVITNLQGVSIYKEQAITTDAKRIETYDWPAGIYIVRIQSEGNVETHKLIKY
ncbi:MAG: T9SS type A sorting domain-containing protein [Bacteroidia bacterium]